MIKTLPKKCEGEKSARTNSLSVAAVGQHSESELYVRKLQLDIQAPAASISL